MAMPWCCECGVVVSWARCCCSRVESEEREQGVGSGNACLAAVKAWGSRGTLTAAPVRVEDMRLWGGA